MAKKRKTRESFKFPLTQTNYIILTIGLLMLIAGYIFMAAVDHPDDVMSRTVAPVIIMISMIIVIPYGILHRDKSE